MGSDVASGHRTSGGYAQPQGYSEEAICGFARAESDASRGAESGMRKKSKAVSRKVSADTQEH